MEPTVLQQVASLAEMPLAELRDRWQALFGRAAPAAYKPKQLIRRLAWRIQELHYGGLSDAATERLRGIAEQDRLTSGSGARRSRSRRALAAGTRLIREWRGVEYVVTAVWGGGFECGGRRYRTLSAVAKAITGQHTSGPRFFGLARHGKEPS